MTDFHLGGLVDPATGDRLDEPLCYPADHLTTHAAIVGMTGSGKTGLGVIFLEEALRAGIPALVLDPKGDMTNLALRFPALRADDFLPWIDAAEARREGRPPEEVAADTARRWSEGLATWGLSGDDVRDLSEHSDVVIFTPGSTAGLPLDVIGSLAPPAADWATEAEAIRDEIQGFASGLLGLIDVDADPLTSREHILISNLVEEAWRNGRSLDMATLLGWIQHPPLRKLGVFDVDTFFPPKDRLELAMRLNGLLAAPGFSAWMEGTPIDVPTLLWDERGRPRAAVVYLAHLSDEERQFVVTLVLSRLVTWMRSQPGSSELRALVYMDEVFGFVPPTAMPPAKKPILTLLKQARAFGVGMILATQNPVDLDYKAMSNAGTWAIGRLQTERDKRRIVDALSSARGDVDVAAISEEISGLGKRQFLLHDVHEDAPRLFTTRWAMSYLRGPLTREQIHVLMQDRHPPGAERPDDDGSTGSLPEMASASPEAGPATAMPPIAAKVPVFHVDPAAPWAARLDADPTATTFAAGLAARLRVHYDDRAAGVDHTEEWEAVFFPAPERLDPERAIHVDYDDRDLREPPGEARYLPPRAPLDDPAYFRQARTALTDHLRRHEKLTIHRNRELRLWSRVGESQEAFAARCAEAASDRIDAELAKRRERYAGKVRRLQERLRKAERAAADADQDLQALTADEFMSAAGSILGAFTGHRSRRSPAAALRRRRSAARRRDSAAAKVDDISADLAAVQQELDDDVAAITARWQEKAAAIEPVELGLESDDVTVEQLAVIWVPVASGSNPRGGTE